MKTKMYIAPQNDLVNKWGPGNRGKNNWKAPNDSKQRRSNSFSQNNIFDSPVTFLVRFFVIKKMHKSIMIKLE